jgi:hypothetical protein
LYIRAGREVGPRGLLFALDIHQCYVRGKGRHHTYERGIEYTSGPKRGRSAESIIRLARCRIAALSGVSNCNYEPGGLLTSKVLEKSPLTLMLEADAVPLGSAEAASLGMSSPGLIAPSVSWPWLLIVGVSAELSGVMGRSVRSGSGRGAESTF